jgi:hypothetical protein
MLHCVHCINNRCKKVTTNSKVNFADSMNHQDCPNIKKRSEKLPHRTCETGGKNRPAATGRRNVKCEKP